MARACTCAVTEYHHHDSVNPALEVEYFTQEELREQFLDHLQSYRNYHSLEPSDIETLADDREVLKIRSDLARDTLWAAFRTQLEQDERFLLENTLEDALLTLLTWAKSTGMPAADKTQMTTRSEFPDHRSCTEHLAMLTSDPTDTDEPAKWPLIRKIKLVSLALDLLLPTMLGCISTPISSAKVWYWLIFQVNLLSFRCSFQAC
jgi:hypothetical protein